MTPPARLAAGIDILETYLSGVPAEKALTTWARRNRYAGSGDRAAIRDLVFDILRQRRSCAALGAGGGMTSGRALVLGYLRLTGQEPERLFTGQKYAPTSLDPAEQALPAPPATWPDPVRLDYPDWLDAELRASLGDKFEPVMRALQSRAPVFLRVNSRKTDISGAIAALLADEIAANPHPLSPYALEITRNARRLSASRAYLDGLVELQDTASQAVVTALPLPKTSRILDYCAGGGGKALALATSPGAAVFAHDIAPERMRDLPIRAARAGVRITRLASESLAKTAPFDVVFCDAPCSGSGAWRRSPAGKWALNASRLAELTTIQARILREASQFVRPAGLLAYATCSLFACENISQIKQLLVGSADFDLIFQQVFTPVDGGDGMFVAVMRKKN